MFDRRSFLELLRLVPRHSGQEGWAQDDGGISAPTEGSAAASVIKSDSLPDLTLSRRNFELAAGMFCAGASVADPSVLDVIQSVPIALESNDPVRLSTLIWSRDSFQLPSHDLNQLPEEVPSCEQLEQQRSFVARLRTTLERNGFDIPRDPRALLLNPGALDAVCRSLLIDEHLEIAEEMVSSAEAAQAVRNFRVVRRDAVVVIDDLVPSCRDDLWSETNFESPVRDSTTRDGKCDSLAERFLDALDPIAFPRSPEFYRYKDEREVGGDLEDSYPDLRRAGIEALQSGKPERTVLREIARLAFERHVRLLKEFLIANPDEVSVLCKSYHQVISRPDSTEPDERETRREQEAAAPKGFTANPSPEGEHPILREYYRTRLPVRHPYF